MSFLMGKTLMAITEKEQGHKSKPSEYKNISDTDFADPVNHKYPIDKEHVMAAWSYINKPENRTKGGYTPAEWALMQKRVKAAMKKYGHEVAEEKKSMLGNSDAFYAYRNAVIQVKNLR